MKKFKSLKIFSMILTLALTFALIPKSIAHAGPTCCDRSNVVLERRGNSHTDTSDHEIKCKAHKITHYCVITKKYGVYWRVCRNCHAYWGKEIRLESTQHTVRTCH